MDVRGTPLYEASEAALTCGARRCTRRVARTRGDGGWCEQGGGGHGRSTPLYKVGVCGCDAKLLVAGASKEAAWTCRARRCTR